jgi:K+ transporter
MLMNVQNALGRLTTSLHQQPVNLELPPRTVKHTEQMKIFVPLVQLLLTTIRIALDFVFQELQMLSASPSLLPLTLAPNVTMASIPRMEFVLLVPLMLIVKPLILQLIPALPVKKHSIQKVEYALPR